MSTMLELYRHRFGAGVKARGKGWNGPCPICGGEVGKSDRFMIWPDREKDLGHTCIENHIPGVFFCRHCGRTGDSIRYMMDMEGMSFREACAELGISDMPVRPRRRPAPLEPQVRAAWQPSVKEVPSEKWRNYAAKLLAEAEAEIWNHPEALNWLAKRGITEEVIRTYRLGYLAGEDGKPGRFRARSVLGLPPKQRNGKDQTWLFIPRGIVIPTFEGGELINLRIRRPNQDIKEREDGTRLAKYLELSGSCSKPMLLLPEGGNPNLRAFVVVEGELDAILCHHAAGRRIGAVAIRSNQTKPDTVAHGQLRNAVCILLALDYEDSGAGIVGLEWWLSTYAACLRWPTPEGKDPGNAFEMGVDIREWLDGGLPETISLMPQGVQLDTLSSGSVSLGGEGRSPESPASLRKKEGGPERCTTSPGLADTRFLAAMPDYLRPEDVPEDVRRAWHLWQGVPVLFVKLEEGGFEWSYSHSWAKQNRDQFEAFWRFQDGSDALWDWLSAHVAAEIGAHNLLKIWG